MTAAYPISEPRSVLLLGNYRPALVIARRLAAAGYKIILGLEGDEGGCELSRYVAEVWDHPVLAEGAGSFLEQLETFLAKRSDIKAVFPVAEEFVNCFAAENWCAPEDVFLIGPGHEVVRTFADKIEALHLALRSGVRTLPYEVVGTHEMLFSSAARIGYPVVIRPLGTTARLNGKKALIVSSREELHDMLPAWPEGHEVLLAQQCARGRRYNIYFAARDGELIGVAASRIERTNHPDGTGLAVCGETIEPPPALVADTRTLVAQHGYTGIGLAQFMHDPATGEICFLELNPRVSGSHAVPESAGVPLSAMAVDLARGVAIDAPSPCRQGTVGLRYVWTSGALIGAKINYLRGEIGLGTMLTTMAQDLARAPLADIHFMWAWDDPKPALRALRLVLPRFTRLRTLIRAILRRRRDEMRPA